MGQIGQQAAVTVFFRQLRRLCQRPVNMDTRVVPAQGVFGIGAVVIGATVDNFCRFITHNAKAVGKAFRYPELAAVVCRQFYARPTAECG